MLSKKARADIMNGGKLTASTIENMVDQLKTATEQDFERAKMLALMTRTKLPYKQ